MADIGLGRFENLVPGNQGSHQLVVLLDRSGSMVTLKEEAEGGLNDLLVQERGSGFDIDFTLYQFDHEFEVVHEGLALGPDQPLPTVRIKPRGSTALYDAVGQTVGRTQARIEALGGSVGKVTLIIVTDGQENASKEVNSDAVRKLLTDAQGVLAADAQAAGGAGDTPPPGSGGDGWDVVYIGADLGDFKDGHGIGARSGMLVKPKDLRPMLGTVGQSLGSYRSGSMSWNAVVDSTAKAVGAQDFYTTGDGDEDADSNTPE